MGRGKRLVIWICVFVFWRVIIVFSDSVSISVKVWYFIVGWVYISVRFVYYFFYWRVNG